jgi:hypothetical protein
LHQFGRHALPMLFNTPAEHVGDVTEIAEMNLISAAGLPGASRIGIEDIAGLLATLDNWTKCVADFTARSHGHYLKNRKLFGSYARFKVAAMLHALSRECGVRYNPDRIADPDNFDDPADSFLHGILGPRKMGTCASLPVLLVAVGRRLDYPMHQVLSPGHCFCRWDGQGERFNVEWNEDGLNSHDDEHYRNWPQPWTLRLHEKELAKPTFLINLTPAQELAYCAHTRAAQLSVAKRHDEALAAAHVAHRLWPTHNHAVWITHLTTVRNFPNMSFPLIPSEQTSGRQSLLRAAAVHGLQVMEIPRSGIVGS